MTETSTEYFWCLRHDAVEKGDQVCPGRFLLGPYGNARDAQNALSDIAKRNEQLDAEDEAWRNGE